MPPHAWWRLSVRQLAYKRFPIGTSSGTRTSAGTWEIHREPSLVSTGHRRSPSRVSAGHRIPSVPRDGITRAYDLTCEEFLDRTPERPAGHWAARLFLLHTNIVDHLPGAATAPAVLAELHTRLSDGSNGVPLSSGTTAALELVTALRERLDAVPVAARDIPACAGEILIRALELATFKGCSLTSTGTGRTAVLVPLVDGLEDPGRRRRFRTRA